MLEIIMTGAGGKMGAMIAEMVQETSDMRIVCGEDKYQSAPRPFPMVKTLEEVTCDADVLVDFSSPEALAGVLAYCKARQMPLVLATTGYNAQQIESIHEYAKELPIFRSANMALGINLLCDLVSKSAFFFGESVDVEIVEKHHNQKADAPSGTALMIYDAINQTYLGQRSAVYGRHPGDGKRQKGELGIHAVRGGTVTGEHSVYFYGTDEIVEIHHSAQSRRIFASGAIQAARFIQNKRPGLYDMHDLLLEKSIVTHLHVEPGIAMITVRGLPFEKDTMARLLTTVADENINVDMISQTAPYADGHVDISFTLPSSALETAKQALLAKGFALLDHAQDFVKLTVEGIGMEKQAGVAARVFSLLARHHVPICLVTTSETKISICTDRESQAAATAAIRQEFGI